MMKEHVVHSSRHNNEPSDSAPDKQEDRPEAQHPAYTPSAETASESSDAFNRNALENERLMNYEKNTSSDAVKRTPPHLAEGGAPSSTKLFIVVALLFIIPLAAAVYLSGMLSKNINDIPVIKADRTPIRVKPDNPGGFFIEHQDKSIYETISGETSGKLPEVMKILPGSEMPANLAETDEGHTMLEDAEPVTDYEPSPPPRIIRLNEPQRITATEIETTTPPDADIQPQTIADLVEEVAVSEEVIQENITDTVVVNPGGVIPIVVLKGPVPRLYAKPIKEASISIARANTPKAPAVMPPAARDNRILKSGSRGRYAQLGAFGNMTDAKRHFNQLEAKIRAAMRDANVSYYFQPVNVDNKGTLYRLKIGEFATESSARAFCDNLINRKIECIYVGY